MSNVAELSDDNFEEAVSSGVTLVDFYAEWCGPCRMLSPVVEELASEMGNSVKFAKVDIEKAQKLAAQFQVTSVPTLILFKDGKESDRLLGLRDKDALKSFVAQ